MKKQEGFTRREFIKLAGLGASAMILAGCEPTPDSDPNPNPASLNLKGLGYSPFRNGQSPNYGVYPTEFQIREDLGIIKYAAPKIRTYGTENILFRIPEFCKDAEIACYPGAWIDNVGADDSQVNNLVSIANQGFNTTKGLIVGNEFTYRHPESKQKLLNYIGQVRNETGKQVGASEQWHIWRDHPDLAPNVDFMFVHVHPYWENQPIENAANFVLEKYNFIKGLYPGKQVFIAETGWPSAGQSRGQAVPSLVNHIKFLDEFVGLANSNGIDYFFFEAFDEPWKRADVGGEVEANWGVFYEDRTVK